MIDLPPMPRRKIIALVSAMGASGKSGLAVSIARSLAQNGQKILLVDADPATAGLLSFLSTRPRSYLQHALRGEKTLNQTIITDPSGPFDVIAADPDGDWSMGKIAARIDDGIFTEDLLLLADDYDHVIIDCGNIPKLLTKADLILMVIATDWPGLSAAATALKEWPWREKTRLVIPTLGPKQQAEQIYRLLTQACQSMGYEAPPLAAETMNTEAASMTIRSV